MIALFLLIHFGNKVVEPIGWIINLLAKTKIVKHPERTKRILEHEFRHYHKNFRLSTKLGLVLEYLFLPSCRCLFIFYFFRFIGFGLSGFDFITILACQSFVFMISAFVPTGRYGGCWRTLCSIFGSIFINIPLYPRLYSVFNLLPRYWLVWRWLSISAEKTNKLW